MPRPAGSQKELEIRRREAIALLKAGFGVNETARRVGASSGSVSRWKAAYESQGSRGLDPKPGHGSSPLLTDAQCERLAAILEAGALAYGLPTELWTLKRVRDVIEREFGIAYHIGHVWRILRRIGFTTQKPERRCRKRDEAAIERFRNETWPEARKKGA